MLQEPFVEEVQETRKLLVVVLEVHRGFVLVDDFAKMCVRLLLICKLAVARHGHDFFFVDVLFDDMIVHRR